MTAIRARIFGFLLMLVALPATAGTTEFRVLFDTDDDATTGCTVAGMEGTEQVLVTQISDDDTTPRVTRTHRQVCSAGSLGAATDVVTTPWNAVWRNSDRQLTFETRLPFSAFGGSMPSDVRVGFDIRRGAASHIALANEDGTPAVIPETTRRRAVGPGEDRTIVLDGTLTDWGSIAPVLFGIQDGGSQALRMVRVLTFANPNDNFLYFAAVARIESGSPFADEDTFSREQGAGVSVNAPGVLQNDGDPNGQPLTALKISEPKKGTVTLNPDGSFTYTPNNPHSEGTDQFEYKATTGNAESNVARVRIKVGTDENPDQGPVDDQYETEEDTTLNVAAPGVLGNDPPGNAGTATLVTPPSHGTVVLNANGGFVYKPAKNFFGTDTFVYSLTVGNSPLGGNATVTIEVESINDSPSLQPATFSIPENSPNGTPVGTVTFSDSDGDDVTVSITSGNTGGAFTIDASTGAISVANSAALDFETTPTFSLTVRVQDDGTPSKSATQIITVNLTNVNDPPVIVAGGTLTYTENDPPSVINGSLTVTDPDSPQLTGASVSISGNFAAGQDVLSFTPVGAITGVFSGNTLTLSGNDTAANYQTALRSVRYQNTSDNPTGGTRTITWTATDGALTSAPVNSSVNVIAVNDAPVAMADPGYAVNEGGTITNATTVLANDTDAEGSPLSAILVSGPANASSFTLDADGTFDYTHNGSETTSDSFTYKANDGTADSNTVTVTIAINPINDAPVLTAGGATAVFTEDGAPVAVDPAISVTDGDDTNLASATVTITNLLDGASETLAANTGGTTIVASYLNGVLTLSGSDSVANYQTVLRSVTYSNASQNPTTTARSISFVVHDGAASSNTVAKNVTIVTINDAPVAVADSGYAVDEGGTITNASTVLANDTDAEGSPLSAILVSGPANASSFTLDADGTFDYTHNGSETTSDSFTYKANDGTADSNTVAVSIGINAINDAPVLTAGGATAIFTEDGAPVAVDPAISVTDGDHTNLASATVTITNLLDGSSETLAANTGGTSIVASYLNGVLTLNGSDSVANYQTVLRSVTYANASQNPTTTARSISFVVNDGTASSNTVAKSVTIVAINDAPVAVADSGYAVNEGGTITNASTVLANDTDAEGSALTAILVSGPANASSFTLNSDGTFDYTHNGSETTSDSFTYKANDGTADSNTVTVSIGINAINDAPVAVADSGYNVNEGGTITNASTVLANDTDGEGSTLSAILVSGPANASSFTLDADGTFDYTHNGSETTTDSFTYKANDGTADSNTVTVSITINAINDAPVAVADSGYAVNEGGTITNASTVLANDTDAEGSTLTAVLVSGPANASSFTLDADGTFDYTHNGSETLSDSFTYKANDGTTDSNTVTVSITVNAINDAPVAVADSGYAVNEGGTITNASTVLANDTDGEGSTLNAILVSGPANASSFTLDADGTFDYTHNGSETTSDSFTYKANDGTADSNTVTVSIGINAINDAPVAVADSGYNVNEGGTITNASTVLANDTDAEGSTLSAILVSGPANASSFTLDPDGTFDYTHNGSETTTDSFTYKANDGTTDSNTVTVSITINATNDAPVAVADSGYAVNEGGTITNASTVLANDTDAEGSTLTAVLVSGPANASSFTLDADGTFDYTHNGSETLSDSFTYKANDGTTDSNTVTVSITINAINDAPVAVADSGYAVNEGGTITNASTVLANDTDGEGSTLTAVLVSGPANASSFTLDADGTFDYTHNGGETTSDSFTYKANDGTADSNVVTVSITINALNDTPVAVADAYAVSEGGTLTETPATGVLANDTDPDSTLTAVLVSGPAQAATFSLNADGSFSYTHNGSETTTDSFTYKANDGTVDSNTVTVTITINAVNDAPVAVADSGYAVNEGGTITNASTVLANDTDTEGNTLTAVLVSGPANASSFTLDTDGTFDYTHNGGETLSDSFTYKANDGTSDSNTVTVSITINPLNDAPVAVADSGYAVAEGGTIANASTVLANDSDAEGTSLTAILVSGPANASSFTLDADGTFDYTHNGGETTSDSFTYKANDGTLDSNTVTVTITINAANDAPVNNMPPPPSVDQDTVLTLAGAGAIQISDVDAGAGPVQVALTATNGTMTLDGTSGLSFTVGDGTADPAMTFTGTLTDINAALDGMTFTPTPAYFGAASIEVDTDDQGNTGTGGPKQDNDDVLNITVNQLNQKPVNAVPGPQTFNEDVALVFSSGNGNQISISDPDAGANDVQATLSVTSGVLTLNGTTGLAFTVGDGTNDATMTFTGTIAAINTSLNGLAYTPNANFSGTDTLSITTNDQGNTGPGGAQQDVDTVTLNVSNVNDAPAGTDAAVGTVEDTQYTFTAANFGFTDPNDTPANALQAVVITTLPAAGSLTLSGSGIAAGAEIAVADITAGNLKFMPAANGNGSPYTTFTFQVRDDGGTANSGVDLDASPNTLTINVTPVNDAPAGTDTTVTADEDVQYTFTAADFGFTDPSDTPANALQSVIITTLPAAGSLTISGSSFPAGTEIPVASITAGNLKFLSALNAFGSPYTTFTFQVRDDGGTANGGVNLDASANTITVNVNPVNDAPTVVNESFDVLGNTELRVDMTAGTTPHTSETTAGASSYEGVLDNDSDIEGDTVKVTAVGSGCADAVAPFDCTLTSGAVVHVEENGEFSFTPGPGDTSDTFQYTVTDVPANGAPISVSGTVTLNFFEMVWYVKQGSSGNGTSIAPFGNFDSLDGIGGAGDVDDASDYLFVHNSGALALSTTVPLETNQHVLGEGVGLSVPVSLNGNGSPTNLVAAGTKPVLTLAAGDMFTVINAIPVEIRGLSMTASGGNVVDVTTAGALSGSSSLTIGDNTIGGAGADGIDINANAGTTGTLALAITNNTWNTAGTHTGIGIDVTRTAGTLNLDISNNTNVLSTGNTAINVNGAVTITGFMNNTIHGDTVGAGISVTNATFDVTPTGAFQQVSGGTTTVGVLGNPVGTDGIILTGIQGDLDFAGLTVYGTTSGVTTTSAADFTGSAGFQFVANDNTAVIQASNGPALSFTTATINLIASQIASTNTNTFGVNLNDVGGTFTAGATSSISSIASAAATAYRITGSSVNATWNGTINTTQGTGVSLTTNTGTYAFTGVLTLSSGANAAFTATSSGTVSSSNTTSTLTTTTGTALNVSNTTIAAADLKFRSISVTGNGTLPASGIILNATGAVGSLDVLGNGGSCSSAGTCTGGAIQNTGGDAISLTNTLTPTFTRVFVNNTGGQGINANNLTAGLTLSDSAITNTGNSDNEHAFKILDVSGTVSVQATTFNNTTEDFFNIDSSTNNNQMILDVGTVTACTFTQPNTLAAIRAGGAFAGNGILVQHRGSKNYTINLSNSTFTDIKLTGIQVGSSASTSTATNVNVNLNNNDFLVSITNTSGNPNNRSNHINIQALNALDIDASITNNVLNGGGGGGIQLGADNSANLNASITGNVVSNQFADGILMAVDESATLTVLIDNNNISNTSSDGMELSNAISPDALNATLNATITNNTVTTHNTNIGANAFVGGIAVFGGASAGDNTRVDIRNNNVSGSPSPSYADYWIDGSSFGDQIDMKGPGVAAVTEASFLAQPNTAGSPPGQKTFIGNTFYNNNAAIPTPTLTP